MSGAVRLPDGSERRAATELRADGRRLVGYAAVFGIEARIGSFREVVMPGAFRASLASGADILALADHDRARLLGRTRSGTLHLAEDGKGLSFAIDLADTSLARDLLTMAERGDIGGASIGFRAADEAWPAADRRELRVVDLLEISIVASHAAYPETSVQARSQGPAGAPALRLRRLLWGAT
jgi:HK97 family phage prohead protease